MRLPIQKNNLILEKTDSDTILLLSIFETPDKKVELAEIVWDTAKDDCDIIFKSNRLQTYIVLYETYCDLIYLLDSAYEYLYVDHLGRN